MKRLFPVLLVVLFALWQIQQKGFQKPIEITSEATTAAKIITGELATVAYVLDGDTIELTDGRRVRYIGIDAPELEECFSDEATAENKLLVEGESVRLEKDISDVDDYGRLLRYVFTDDEFVNEKLVRNGFARAWNVPPDIVYKDELFPSQELAKTNSLGLWQACKK